MMTGNDEKSLLINEFLLQETRCSVFQSSLVYQVTLLGSSVVAVNHTSCGEVCIVNFQNFSSATEEYRVSLGAINVIGTSEFVEYPATIGTFNALTKHNHD